MRVKHTRSWAWLCRSAAGSWGHPGLCSETLSEKMASSQAWVLKNLSDPSEWSPCAEERMIDSWMRSSKNPLRPTQRATGFLSSHWFPWNQTQDFIHALKALFHDPSPDILFNSNSLRNSIYIYHINLYLYKEIYLYIIYTFIFIQINIFIHSI